MKASRTVLWQGGYDTTNKEIITFPPSLSVFQLLRTVPNKLLGVVLMAAVPVALAFVPFIENINKFQNPFRRPIATTLFLVGTLVAVWLGIGATLPIEISLTFGLF